MKEKNTKNDAQNGAHKTIVISDHKPQLTMKELIDTISALGIKKANTEVWQLLLLGSLAGLYIGFGGMVFLVAMAEGMGKVLSGAAFGVGLVLVVIAGAELFTGNIIMLIGTLAKRFPVRRMFRNWIVVYLGNFIGAFLFALLITKSGLLAGSIGQLAVKITDAKLALSFQHCFIRGIFCNMLVLLAIIMATMSKDTFSKILCCILPIMVFVASGFEHCVANMFFIPLGLFAKSVPLAEQLTMFKNIIPVTLGNIVGGLFVLLLHPNRIRQIQFLLKNSFSK